MAFTPGIVSLSPDVVGNVTGVSETTVSGPSPGAAAAALGLPVFALSWDVDESPVFAVVAGNVPESSRRRSSGEMCGAVRRPGELRAVVPWEFELGDAVELDVDAAGWRDAVRMPEMLGAKELDGCDLG